MTFSELQLSPSLLRAVTEAGYTTPTPIQVRAIPHVLAGRDLLGLAQTGTGKTAAFALPILHGLAKRHPDLAAPTPRPGPRPVRVLVVTPTRELAGQIEESFATYGAHLGLTHTVIFGGVSPRPQEATLRHGVDILVATPGRLLDHLGQGVFDLANLEVLVLDEADRMLDMGFLPDVRRILKYVPAKRQNLFFSATMPPEVRTLAQQILVDPVEVAVTPPATTAEKVDQTVYFVRSSDKRALLVTLLANPALKRVLVFTRTKHGANRLAEHLNIWGTHAAVIHGNKSQNAREKALSGFKAGDVRVLVATDIAARGIDVDGVTHVINFELPEVPESYVHRIGRTARAGASGSAVALCAPDEVPLLRDIERAIRMKVPVSETPSLAASLLVAPPEAERAVSIERRGEGRAREKAKRSAASGGGRGRGGEKSPQNEPRSGGDAARAQGKGNPARGEERSPGGQPHRQGSRDPKPGGRSNARDEAGAPARNVGRPRGDNPPSRGDAPARAPEANPTPFRQFAGETLSGRAVKRGPS